MIASRVVAMGDDIPFDDRVEMAVVGRMMMHIRLQQVLQKDTSPEFYEFLGTLMENASNLPADRIMRCLRAVHTITDPPNLVDI